MTLNRIPAGGPVWLPMPDPERLAEQAMAVHHIIRLLVDDRLSRASLTRGCELRGETMTVLNDCAERCGQLARDIDRLARAG